MAPSKGVQVALIGSIGALFFVAALAADRGVSPAVLGGACVVALLVIFLVVRRTGPQGATRQRPGSRWRTLAVLAGLGLLKVSQLPSASAPIKIASVAAAIALFVWAVVSSRHSVR